MTVLGPLVANKLVGSIAGKPSRGADDSIVFREAVASGGYDDADWVVEGSRRCWCPGRGRRPTRRGKLSPVRVLVVHRVQLGVGKNVGGGSDVECRFGLA
jgi:hypothetical protein